MLKKTNYLLIFLLLANTVFAQGITLLDAVNSAMENNEQIKRQNAVLEQREYENLAAWGNFLPKIDITGKFTHLNDPLQISLSPIRDAMIALHTGTKADLANLQNVVMTGAPIPDAQLLALQGQIAGQLDAALPAFNSTLKEQDYKTATIQGVLPIFMGGKLWAAKKYARSEEESANTQLTQTRNEVISETVNNYLTVILLKKVVKVRENVYQTMLEHKKQAQQLLNEDVIAKYDYMRAEVAVAEAKRKLDDDKNNLSLAVMALNSAMGTNLEEKQVISDTLTQPVNIENLDYYVELTNKYQPIFQLLHNKKYAAAQKYNVALSKMLPSIAAFGKYEMYPEYLSALEPRWAVGVQAQLNIFNGLKDYLGLQSAKKLEDEVKYIEQDTKKKISLLINKLFRDVENSKNRYEKLTPTLNLATESYRLNQKRFNSGMGTSLDVIDARLTLEVSQIEQIKSAYEFYRSLNQLYLAAGKPDELLKIWNK